MANEIDLNDLTIKTDSLPDSWKVILIDPTTGLPARNMTVARFIELLTSKMPVATDKTNGLFSNENYKQLSSLKYKSGTSSDNQYILLMRTADYHYSQGCALIWAGNLSASLIGPVCAVIKKNSVPVLTSLGINPGLTRGYYYRVYNDMLELYVKSDTNMEVSITPLGYFGVTYPMTVSSDPGGLTELTIQTGRSVAVKQNALTDTITTSPVLESRQVAANLPAETSISNFSREQSVQSGQDGSIPVKSEPSGEQYIWSIDKIGKAVLELQAENKRLKQILNISDDSEVQQM